MAGTGGKTGTTALGAKVAAGLAAGAITLTATAGTVQMYDAISGLAVGTKASSMYNEMRKAQGTLPAETRTAESTAGGDMYDAIGGLSGDEPAQQEGFVLRDATVSGKLIGEDEIPRYEITLNVHADGTVDGTFGGTWTGTNLQGDPQQHQWSGGTFAGTVSPSGFIYAGGEYDLTLTENGQIVDFEWARAPWRRSFNMSGQLGEDYSFVGHVETHSKADAGGNPMSEDVGDYYVVSASE
jgi:hypothetical protein